MVDGSTPEETLEILNNLKDKYEHHHKVTYSDESYSKHVFHWQIGTSQIENSPIRQLTFDEVES